MKSIYLSIFLLFLTILPSKAAHIVGGEIYYDCLGNDDYRITLKVYRDCFSAGAPFDNPANIGVYNSSGVLLQTLTPSPSITNIPIDINNPCLVAPPNVCVEEAIYTWIVNLPPTSGGYDIVYQRCCRNATIINLSTPDQQGASYITHIPGSGIVTCNSSPHFLNFPPIAICGNEPLNFDHAATDPDGDVLVYSLCAPFVGGSQAVPQPIPPAPPPYTTVQYAAGFSATFPMTSSPAISIDPNTGLLTGTPTALGQYVIGVCVEEYRNNVLIGTHRRDFQFNVANCDPVVIAAIPTVLPDTVIIECLDLTVSFGNSSVGASAYHWDFGVTTSTSDTSNLNSPSFTYPDTGTYIVMLIANPGLNCSDTDYVHVIISPLNDADFSFTQACEGNPVQFTDQTITNGILTNWQWTFGDGGNSSIQNPQHIYQNNGAYFVELIVTNNVGCTDSITKEITVFDSPTVNAGPDTIICPGGQVTLSVPSGFQSYTWMAGAVPISSNSSVTVNPTQTTNYLITVTNQFNCEDTDTVTVEVETLNSTSEPSSHCSDDSIGLDAGSPGATYLWSTGETTQAIVVTQTGIYTVDIYITGQLCPDKKAFDITVKECIFVMIPNAFSPNNDGINDILNVFGKNIATLELYIYNRWGEEIYYTASLDVLNDNLKGWDGTYKGELQNVGVYTYYLKAGTTKGEELSQTGNITLLR